MNVVADRALQQRRLGRGHFRRRDPFQAQELIDGRRVHGGEELVSRVGALVLAGAGDVEQTRGDERGEHVLIHGQVLLAAVEVLVVLAEPVRKILVDVGNAFPAFPACNRCARAAGVVAHHHCEALIFRPGPERRLASARMSHHSHALRIDAGVRHEIIHAATRAPGPGGNGAPGIGRPLGRVEHRVHSLRPGICFVRRHVAIVKRRRGVAPRDHLFRGPEWALHRARGVDVGLRAIANEEQARRRFARPIWQEERKVNRPPAALSAKADGDLLARGFPLHGIR